MAEFSTDVSASTQPTRAYHSKFNELWQNAIEAYKSSTGSNLSDIPLHLELEACASVGDVVFILNLNDKGFKRFRETGHKFWAVMTLISRMLGIVTETGGEVATAKSAPGGKSVFVALGRLLQATRGVGEAYDTIEKGFAKLERFFNRLDTHLRSPLTITAQLREIFEKMLVEVLKFTGLLTKYIDDLVEGTSASRIKKAVFRFTRRAQDFGSALFDRSDVKKLLENLNELTAEENFRIATEIHVIVHAINEGVKLVRNDVANVAVTQICVERDARQAASQANALVNNQIDNDIRHWLSPPNPSLNHDRVHKARQSGTCNWIFGEEFQEWRGRPNGVYWLHGSPGSGKSTLCSSVVERLISENEPVVYFYFDFRDPSKQTTVGLLASLTYQLATSSTSCYGILEAFYARNKSSLDPREQMLVDCLIEMLHSCKKITVVLDALDECPGATRGADLLPLLDNLIGRNIEGLRLLMTSRLEKDIKTKFNLNNRLIIMSDIQQKQEHIDDIERYIEQTLSHSAYSEWPVDIKKLATRILLSKSQGMFLWVCLQLRDLQTCKPIDVEHTLEELPASLDATYERILRTFYTNKKVAERIRRILECVAFGRYGLDADGLAELFAIDFTDGATLRPDLRSQDPISSLLDSCSGLIHAVHSFHGPRTQRVEFAHYTVQEYLLSDSLPENLRFFALQPESGHATLAQMCLAAVTPSDSESPLKSYAIRNLGWHTRRCPDDADVHKSFSRILLPGNFERSHLHDNENQQPLYWAVREGLVRQIEFLLDLGSVDIDAIGGVLGTALCAAVSGGNLEADELLIGREAPMEIGGGFGTPLHPAARWGYTEIVKLLLDRGACIDARGPDGQTALHEAARRESDEAITLLLERGSNVDVTDEYGRTPLHYASYHTSVSSARLLLKNATANARDKRGRTPLHHASDSYSSDENAASDLVSLLLERGASLDSCDEDGNAPIHVAAMGIHSSNMIHVLLKHGAKIDVANYHGQLPLYLATKSGNLDGACLLLEWGVPHKASLPAGWTILHEAAFPYRFQSIDLPGLRHCYPTLDLLDLEARTDCGQTALSIASASRTEDSVHNLLELGANVNAVDSNGFRAIDYAAARGHADMIELLLEHGADGWTESGPCGTYMDIAARTHQANRLKPEDWKGLYNLCVAEWERRSIAAWPRHIGKDLGTLVTEGRSTVARGERMMRRVRRHRSMGCLPASIRSRAYISAVYKLEGDDISNRDLLDTLGSRGILELGFLKTSSDRHRLGASSSGRVG